MVDRGLPLCVGSEAELERLAEALDATQESRGGLILLTGDARSGRRASVELDLPGAELSRAVGLGGRDRPAASNAERARVSVTRAIRSASEAIEDHHEELGSHLTASVEPGHAPAAGDEVAWRVERSIQAS
jgi:hypothetical protein